QLIDNSQKELNKKLLDLNGADFSSVDFSSLSRKIHYEEGAISFQFSLYLPNVQLQNTSFRNIELHGCDFSLSNLESSDFTGANIVNTDFNGTNLQYSTFVGGILLRVRFYETSLQNSIIIPFLSEYNTDITFMDVDFTRANLRNATINVTQLMGAYSLDRTMLPNGTFYLEAPLNQNLIVPEPKNLHDCLMNVNDIGSPMDDGWTKNSSISLTHNWILKDFITTGRAQVVNTSSTIFTADCLYWGGKSSVNTTTMTRIISLEKYMKWLRYGRLRYELQGDFGTINNHTYGDYCQLRREHT
ncbi:unnamed protein product, partial [Didymodactylos carnosus]